MRQWLEHNKIFFEVFSYLFLGLASIAVGFMSWKTGERELELSEIDRNPVIIVSLDRTSPEKELSVYNDGYHLFEPIIFTTTVFQIEQQLNGFYNKYYHFVVENYYLETPENGQTRGEIVRYKLHDLAIGQVDRIREELKKINASENTRIKLKEFVFVNVSYKDINQNYFDRIFFVDNYIHETSSSHFNLILGKVDEKKDASKLAEISGEKIFQSLKNKKNIPYSIKVKMVSEKNDSI